jgi:nondiscriminating glutamyl-tRNA synthetase
MNEIRVRIAPSPTGFLHVGTARTALFNYLFAKGHCGKFILRIEDTDTERSQEVYTQNIYDSLKALGLTWDEGPDVGGPYGPYRQMERLSIYQEWAEKLLDAGLAYYDYTSEAELEALRQKASETKQDFVFRKPDWDAQTLEQFKADPSRKPSIRFQIPLGQKTVLVQDIIRGDIPFDTSLMGDFVIMKSNGTPSYNFAVVVDDILMKISHVIRGEDHISNTPKQILLFQALRHPLPQFAHVGMILAPDRTKLSKRHGATAVSEFIKQGYLPEAFCNFLALLGWAPPDGEEFATVEKLASQFDLAKIAHNPAIFDKDKLHWLNGMTIRDLPLAEFVQRAQPFIQELDLTAYTPQQLSILLDAVRSKITLLEELPHHLAPFIGLDVAIDEQVRQEVLMTEDTRQVLLTFESTFLSQNDLMDTHQISDGLKAFSESLKPMKTKTVMWAIRAAVTGRTQGTDLPVTLQLLGKDRVAKRVADALSKIPQQVG